MISLTIKIQCFTPTIQLLKPLRCFHKKKKTKQKEKRYLSSTNVNEVFKLNYILNSHNFLPLDLYSPLLLNLSGLTSLFVFSNP